MERITLSRDSDLEVYDPDIDFFLDKIQKNEYFSYTRQLHGFWDAIIGALILDPSLCKLSREEEWLKALSSVMVKAKNAMNPLRYSDEVYFDVLKMIVNLDQYPGNFYFGVSDVNFYSTKLPEHSAYDLVSGFPAFRLLPVHNKSRCFTPTYGDRQQIIRYFLPDNYVPVNGVIWRKYGFRGSLIRLFEKLKNLPVVIVGPAHYSSFGQVAKLDKFYHIPIHGTRASFSRFQILDSIKQLHQKISGKQSLTFLFVAGTLSCWFINQLHGKLDRTNLIDTGLALDTLFTNKDVKIRNQFHFIEAAESSPAAAGHNKSGTSPGLEAKRGKMMVNDAGVVTFEQSGINRFMCIFMTVKAKMEFFIAYKIKIYRIKKYKIVRKMVNYYWRIEKKIS